MAWGALRDRRGVGNGLAWLGKDAGHQPVPNPAVGSHSSHRLSSFQASPSCPPQLPPPQLAPSLSILGTCRVILHAKLPGHPVPQPYNPHREFLPNRQSKPVSLSPFPLVLSLFALVSSPSPFLLRVPFRHWQVAVRPPQSFFQEKEPQFPQPFLTAVPIQTLCPVLGSSVQERQGEGPGKATKSGSGASPC